MRLEDETGRRRFPAFLLARLYFIKTLTYILSNLYSGGMKTAKLFRNGQSQAVRLPKEFRFEGESVFIHHVGNYVVLVPRDDPWRSMFEATKLFTDDFMSERDQGAQPERESLD
jgi:antitoxin VapB